MSEFKLGDTVETLDAGYVFIIQAIDDKQAYCRGNHTLYNLSNLKIIEATSIDKLIQLLPRNSDSFGGLHKEYFDLSLGNVIEYIRGLEARIDELEAKERGE